MKKVGLQRGNKILEEMWWFGLEAHKESVGIAAREQVKRRKGGGSHWGHKKKVLGEAREQDNKKWQGLALGAHKESFRVKKRGKKEKKRKRVLHAGDTERNRWGCSTRTREKIKGWGFTRLRHTTKWLGLKREIRRKKMGKRCT